MEKTRDLDQQIRVAIDRLGLGDQGAGSRGEAPPPLSAGN
jgi:hypothetical protein